MSDVTGLLDFAGLGELPSFGGFGAASGSPGGVVDGPPGFYDIEDPQELKRFMNRVRSDLDRARGKKQVLNSRAAKWRKTLGLEPKVPPYEGAPNVTMPLTRTKRDGVIAHLTDALDVEPFFSAEGYTAEAMDVLPVYESLMERELISGDGRQQYLMGLREAVDVGTAVLGWTLAYNAADEVVIQETLTRFENFFAYPVAVDELTNCFHGDTKVLTLEHGPVPLRDIAGHQVTVLARDGQWREATASSHGRQQLFRYRFGGIRGHLAQRTLDVVATANHRWFLEDGTITTDLSVGDVLESLPEPEFTEDAAAIRHGLVFGDGTVHKKRFGNGKLVAQGTGYVSIRLCGDSRSFLPYFQDDYTVNYPPSAKGDPVVYIGRDNGLWKELPTTTDPDYIHSFIRGWWMADGYKANLGSSIEIATSHPEAVQWLEDYAGYAGYTVSSANRRERKPGDGSYTNGKPIYYVRLSRKPYRVLAVEEYGYDEVFCIEEPHTTGFVLANGLLTGNCSTFRRYKEPWFVLKRMADAGMVNPDVVELMRESGGDGQQLVNEESRDGTADGDFSEEQRLHTLWECYCRWNGELWHVRFNERDAQQPLSVKRNPFAEAFDAPPYQLMRVMHSPGYLWGTSIPQLLDAIQKIFDAAENSRLAYNQFAITPVVQVDRMGSVGRSLEDGGLTPGKIIYTPGPPDMAGISVLQLPKPDLTLEEMEAAQRFADMATFNDFQVAGDPFASGRRTATEVRTSFNIGTLKLRAMLRDVREDLSRAARMRWALIELFRTRPRGVVPVYREGQQYLISSDGVTSQELQAAFQEFAVSEGITPEDLAQLSGPGVFMNEYTLVGGAIPGMKRDDIRWRPNGGDIIPDKLAELQKIDGFAPYMNWLGAAQQDQRIWEFLKTRLLLMGRYDWKKYIGESPKVMMEMQQYAELMAMLTAQSAQLANNGSQG